MSDDIYTTILVNLLQVGVPFAAFFAGIVIRKRALPGKNSLPLGRQCLLGIPVSLVVISPVLGIFHDVLRDMQAYLASVGIIIEHGMLVTETVTYHMHRILGSGH